VKNCERSKEYETTVLVLVIEEEMRVTCQLFGDDNDQSHFCDQLYAKECEKSIENSTAAVVYCINPECENSYVRTV
jgi:hypothetical protein